MESPQPPNETSDVATRPASDRHKRSLRNWNLSNEIVLAFVGLTVVACLLIIPRPTYPQILPLPRIDTNQLKQREQLEIRRALMARDGSLDKETRAIGEQVRRLGAQLAEGRALRVRALQILRDDVSALLERKEKDEVLSGEEALLRLRALQGQMFLEAANEWQKDKKLSTELAELGGQFHQICRDAWLDSSGDFLLSEDELRLFFRAHWGKLTGLFQHPGFSPSLEELRRYYSTNLQHPANAPGDLEGQARTQLGFARALGKVDPSYPSTLAAGILQLRMGDALGAVHSLEAHLEQHPDGPWAQLARNHLMSAARKANLQASEAL